MLNQEPDRDNLLRLHYIIPLVLCSLFLFSTFKGKVLMQLCEMIYQTCYVISTCHTINWNYVERERSEIRITQNRSIKGKLLPTKRRVLRMKDTNKLKEHTETCFMRFDSKKGLCESEENTCEHVIPSLLCVHIHLLSSDSQRPLWGSKHLS